MKFVESYSLRGEIDSAQNNFYKIPIFQGRYDIGFKVVDFQLSYPDRTEANTRVIHAMLATENLGDTTEWDWSDNRQFAWALSTFDANAVSQTSPGILTIDPDNLIIEDLYIGAYVYGGIVSKINYMITIEKYELPPYQGTAAIVNNMSQG